MKLGRLISIIYKLLNHALLSAFRRISSISQRTIYRDIDAICAGRDTGLNHIREVKMDMASW
jgi:predicted DNA-binding transcriptional regulator YafY